MNRIENSIDSKDQASESAINELNSVNGTDIVDQSKDLLSSDAKDIFDSLKSYNWWPNDDKETIDSLKSSLNDIGLNADSMTMDSLKNSSSEDKAHVLIDTKWATNDIYRLTKRAFNNATWRLESSILKWLKSWNDEYDTARAEVARTKANFLNQQNYVIQNLHRNNQDLLDTVWFNDGDSLSSLANNYLTKQIDNGISFASNAGSINKIIDK